MRFCSISLTICVDDIQPHVVVNAPPGQDHLRVIAQLLLPCGSGNTDRRRCSARQPGPAGTAGSSTWCRRPSAPLRYRCQALEDHRQFVDQRDVDVALRVLDHLGGLGDLDARGLVRAGRNDGRVHLVDKVGRFRRRAEVTFRIDGRRCSLSPGLMRSGL